MSVKLFGTFDVMVMLKFKFTSGEVFVDMMFLELFFSVLVVEEYVILCIFSVMEDKVKLVSMVVLVFKVLFVSVFEIESVELVYVKV